MLSPSCEVFDRVQEVQLCLLVPVDDSLSRILRERCVLDDKLVQVVSQEVSACISAMTVKDSEEAALWPDFNFFL